jgi:hypothetical protein
VRRGAALDADAIVHFLSVTFRRSSRTHEDTPTA